MLKSAISTAVLALLALRAQEPYFRVSVNLVQVDSVVTDCYHLASEPGGAATCGASRARSCGFQRCAASKVCVPGPTSNPRSALPPAEDVRFA